MNTPPADAIAEPTSANGPKNAAPIFQSDSSLNASRRRFGFLLLLGLLAAFAGGKAVLFDTMDPDCFWHLKVADQLLIDGIGPITDKLSFASIKSPWTPYSWLAELGMKGIWDAGGYRLAIAVQAVMQAAFIVLLAWSARLALPALPARARLIPPLDSLRRSDAAAPTYLACCAATAAMGFISLPYLSFRPVTAALVLLGVCMMLIVRDRARGERTRAVWLVPVITAVVVNLHLSAVFVPMWFGALLAGAVWERFAIAEPPEHEEACRRIGRCFLLTAASGVACCCTPMLPGLVQTAFYYRAADPMVASGILSEMRPFFHGTMGTANAGIVGVTLVLILCRLGRFRTGERLLLALGVVLLAQWGRFAPVFAIIAGSMLAVALGRSMSDRVLARKPIVVAMTAVLAIMLGKIVAEFPANDRPMSAWLNRHGPDAPGYPADAARFVATNVSPRTGRLVSEFTWGGYLGWHLGDRYQVLLDGRTQLFTAEFWQATYLNGESARRDYLKTVDADAAVLPARTSLFRHALVKQGWRSVYADSHAEVLVPPARAVIVDTREAVPASDKPKRWGVISSLLE